jgi:hypothetical protein
MIMRIKIVWLVLYVASVVLLAGCPDENDYDTAVVELTVINYTKKPLGVYVSVDYTHKFLVGAGARETKKLGIPTGTADDMQTFNGKTIDIFDTSSGDWEKWQLIKRIKDAGDVIEFVSAETYTEDPECFSFTVTTVKKFKYKFIITDSVLGIKNGDISKNGVDGEDAAPDDGNTGGNNDGDNNNETD